MAKLATSTKSSSQSPGAPALPEGGADAAQISLNRLVELQGQFSGILDSLLITGLGNVDLAIDQTLARIGALTCADRVFVFTARDTNRRINNNHEWCAEGIAPGWTGLLDMPLDRLEKIGWMARFRAGEGIQIEDALALPMNAPDRKVLTSRGIRSFLAVPIQQEGRFLGFIGYACMHRSCRSAAGEYQLIQSVAKVLYWVLTRHECEMRQSSAHQIALSQRNRLRAVLGAMPGLVMEVDFDGRFIAWYSDPGRIPHALRDLESGMLLRDYGPDDPRHVLGKAVAQIVSQDVSQGKPISIGQGPHRRLYEVSASSINHAGYLVVLHDVTDRCRQTSEIELLSDVVRRMTNLVLVTDAERRIEWVNAAFEELTGWTLDQVRGQKPQDFMRLEKTSTSCGGLIDKNLSKGEAAQTEILNRTRDGREIWLSLDIQPLRNSDGTIRGFVAVGSDITKSRRHADELEQAARTAASACATLEAAVGSLQDGFALFDPDDRLVICNQRYREFWPVPENLLRPGARFEEILRESLKYGHYPDAIGREADFIAERMKLRNQPHYEIQQQTMGGRWTRIFGRATPDGGRVSLIVDITKLKQAEARAEAELAAALEASHDGIAFADPQGRITYINHSHLKLFGYHDESEVLGQSWHIFYEPEVIKWIEANAVPQLCAAGHWSGELIGRHRDGSKVEQDLSLTLKDDGGILAIMRDMSVRHREEAERNRLREELRISRRREVISQLAAGLAHDFNNILATISCGAALIEQTSEPGSLARINALRLLAAAGQAEALIRRLLRLDAGSGEPQLLDLRDPVHEAAELIRVGLRNKATLHLEIEDSPLALVVDPTDVLQVVLNLAINASDAITAPTGDIVITLRKATVDDLTGPVALGWVDPSRHYYCLSVADTGCGMAPDIAAKAFAAYFTTKGSEGTGLGLAVVASIMRANDGAIRLETRAGFGSTFTTLWPAEPRSESGQKVSGDLKGHLDGCLILLVDDKPEVLEMLTEILEVAGAEVASTILPEEARDVIAADPGLWDAVITDYDMPGMNGTELAVAIRAITSQVPILLISSQVRKADLPPGLFAATIKKPVKPTQLVQMVAEQIRKSKG